MLGPCEVDVHDLYDRHRRPPVALLRLARTLEERACLMSQWLCTSVPRTERRGPAIASSALTMMAGEFPRVDRLAMQLDCSRRILERSFRSSIGLSPAQFQRLRRVNATLPAVLLGRIGLAQIAADSGYADQAHFTREFRAVVGIAPGQSRREQLASAALLPHVDVPEAHVGGAGVGRVTTGPLGQSPLLIPAARPIGVTFSAASSAE